MTSYNTMKFYCKTCKEVTHHKVFSISDINKIMNADYNMQKDPWCYCTICGEKIQTCVDNCGEFKMRIHLNDNLVYCNSCKAFTDNVEPFGSYRGFDDGFFYFWCSCGSCKRGTDKYPPLGKHSKYCLGGKESYFWCTCGSCDGFKHRFQSKIGCDDN